MGTLKLLEVTERGNVEIGLLSNEATVIGRDPDYGIKLESEAVSGEHGVFVPFRGHWLFRDLGSTNGSSVNGIVAKKGIPLLVRPGDLVQVADRVLTMAPTDEASDTGARFPRSLIVFSRNEPLDEFPVPEAGRALVIGGTKSDLKLDVDVHDLPSLVIEARGDSLVAFAVAKETLPLLNGEPLSRSFTLSDRDELVIEHYRVVVSLVIPMQGKTGSLATMGNFSVFEDEREGKTRISIPFGRSSQGKVDGKEEPEQMSSRDGHPGKRQMAPSDSNPALQHVEDIIVFIMGSILLVTFLGLIVWWLLSLL